MVPPKFCSSNLSPPKSSAENISNRPELSENRATTAHLHVPKECREPSAASPSDSQKQVAYALRNSEEYTPSKGGEVYHEHILDQAQPLEPLSFPNPPLRGDGIPPTTIPNVAFLLERYGITVRYNVVKKRLEVSWPGQSGTLDNASSVALTTIVSLGSLNRLNTWAFQGILETLADRNPYNPVANWILSKAWDGTDRLSEFQATLVEREGYPEPLKDILLHRWLISAVAAALSPNGFYCRGILTLQGPQSIGKTSWIRALVPDPILREQVLKLDHHLDAGNKDSQITAVSHWIVEIGELDSSLKKDVARLKGFITSDRDKLRKPYGRADSEYQRRTVFCASVNDEAFLVDPTGNTRFWTIPVTKINYQHTIDMQQLFAQIARDFDNGMDWWLDHYEESLLEECNQGKRSIDDVIDADD